MYLELITEFAMTLLFCCESFPLDIAARPG